LLVLTWPLLGADCFPLIGQEPRTPLPGIQLAAAIEAPSVETEVAPGEIVRIEWSAGNLTGQTARVALFAESRTDLSRILLQDGIEIAGTGGIGSFDWDTTGLEGLFAAVVTIQAGNVSAEDAGANLITIASPGGEGEEGG
jgi:hypothetical protein